MADKDFTFDEITKKMALQLRRSGAQSLCGTREDESASFLASLAVTQPAPRKKASNPGPSDAPRKKAKKMIKNYELLPPSDNRPQKVVDVTPLPRLERAAATPPPENPALDVFGLLRVLLRRRIWIYIGSATMLAAAALVCLVMTPEYVATSRLQLLTQEMGRLSLKDGDGGGGFDFYSTLQTYVTVMQSDTLALQAIKELNLENEKGFRFSPLIKTDEAKRQMAAPLDQAPLKRAAILRKFKANLLVESMAGTRLITVSYKDSDPEVAAKVVNQLVSDFVEYNFKVRYNATTKATDFLSKQLVDLKSEVEKSQARAVELQKTSGILGADEHDNIIITRLEQLNSELTAAQANRIVKEAVYNLARNGNPEQIAGLLATAGGDSGSSSEAGDLLALISHLRQQESDLTTEYADASAKYGPAYPKLIEMKERLASLRSQIQTQLGKVLETAKSEYDLAASREATAKRMFEEQKALATRMNDRAIDYTIAKHEAESNRVLYDNLQQKLKEADVLAGLRSSELNIVDAAVAPGRPNKPRVPLYLAAGLMAGLALGVVAAFVVEALDRTMRNPEEIESTTQIPILGIVPQGSASVGIEAKDWLSAYAMSDGNGAARKAALVLGPENCAVAEAFRWVRTSLLLSKPQEPPKVFMLASATAGEGKSFTSLNLAAALAQNGSRVLLVDADLRRGTLSKILKKNSDGGLSEALLGDSQPGDYKQLDELPELTFLPAGALLSSPAELLGSSRMTEMIESWRREFSYVVIDTPALLPVTDAVVLSPQVDTVIMVARFAYTQSQSIVRAIRLLRSVQVKSIGVLVNAMDTQSAEYSHYGGSYGYASYDNEDPQPLASRSSRRGRGGETA